MTTGKVLSKGVMKDGSKSIFKGMIRIAKDAKNSQSYLGEHSLLLSKEAKSDAIPGLEIETNDVKATHAASVSQIDDEKIFYLMARGLDKDEAKKLIITGFFSPIIERMPSMQIRSR